MDGAAKFSLLLNVDQALPAQADTGCDPAGATEADIPQTDHRQAVHLTGHFSSSIDLERITLNHVPNPLLKEIRPVKLLLNRLLYVIGGNIG